MPKQPQIIYMIVDIMKSLELCEQLSDFLIYISVDIYSSLDWNTHHNEPADLHVSRYYKVFRPALIANLLPYLHISRY